MTLLRDRVRKLKAYALSVGINDCDISVAAIGTIRTRILLRINVSNEGEMTVIEPVPILKELKTAFNFSLEVRSRKKGEVGAIIASNIRWRDNCSKAG